MSNFSSKTNFRAAVLAATGIMLEHSNLYAIGVQMDHETAPPTSPEPEESG